MMLTDALMSLYVCIFLNTLKHLAPRKTFDILELYKSDYYYYYYYKFSITFNVILRSFSGTGKIGSIVVFNILEHPKIVK